MKIWYAVLDFDPDSESKFAMTTGWECADDRVAEDCAEDYVARHDGWVGWENGQSRAFALFSEHGLAFGIYDVTMERTVTFRAATRKEE